MSSPFGPTNNAKIKQKIKPASNPFLDAIAPVQPKEAPKPAVPQKNPKSSATIGAKIPRKSTVAPNPFQATVEKTTGIPTVNVNKPGEQSLTQLAISDPTYDQRTFGPASGRGSVEPGLREQELIRTMAKFDQDVFGIQTLGDDSKIPAAMKSDPRFKEAWAARAAYKAEIRRRFEQYDSMKSTQDFVKAGGQTEDLVEANKVLQDEQRKEQTFGDRLSGLGMEYLSGPVGWAIKGANALGSVAGGAGIPEQRGAADIGLDIAKDHPNVFNGPDDAVAFAKYLGSIIVDSTNVASRGYRTAVGAVSDADEYVKSGLAIGDMAGQAGLAAAIPGTGLANIAWRTMLMDVPQFAQAVEDNGGDVGSVADQYIGMFKNAINPAFYLDQTIPLSQKVSTGLIGALTVHGTMKTLGRGPAIFQAAQEGGLSGFIKALNRETPSEIEAMGLKRMANEVRPLVKTQGTLVAKWERNFLENGTDPALARDAAIYQAGQELIARGWQEAFDANPGLAKANADLTPKGDFTLKMPEQPKAEPVPVAQQVFHAGNKIGESHRITGSTVYDGDARVRGIWVADSPEEALRSHLLAGNVRDQESPHLNATPMPENMLDAGGQSYSKFDRDRLQEIYDQGYAGLKNVTDTGGVRSHMIFENQASWSDLPEQPIKGERGWEMPQTWKNQNLSDTSAPSAGNEPSPLGGKASGKQNAGSSAETLSGTQSGALTNGVGANSSESPTLPKRTPDDIRAEIAALNAERAKGGTGNRGSRIRGASSKIGKKDLELLGKAVSLHVELGIATAKEFIASVRANMPNFAHIKDDVLTKLWQDQVPKGKTVKERVAELNNTIIMGDKNSPEVEAANYEIDQLLRHQERGTIGPDDEIPGDLPVLAPDRVQREIDATNALADMLDAAKLEKALKINGVRTPIKDWPRAIATGVADWVRNHLGVANVNSESRAIATARLLDLLELDRRLNESMTNPMLKAEFEDQLKSYAEIAARSAKKSGRANNLDTIYEITKAKLDVMASPKEHLDLQSFLNTHRLGMKNLFETIQSAFGDPADGAHIAIAITKPLIDAQTAATVAQAAARELTRSFKWVTNAEARSITHQYLQLRHYLAAGEQLMASGVEADVARGEAAIKAAQDFIALYPGVNNVDEFLAVRSKEWASVNPNAGFDLAQEILADAKAMRTMMDAVAANRNVAAEVLGEPLIGVLAEYAPGHTISPRATNAEAWRAGMVHDRTSSGFMGGASVNDSPEFITLAHTFEKEFGPIYSEMAPGSSPMSRLSPGDAVTSFERYIESVAFNRHAIQAKAIIKGVTESLLTVDEPSMTNLKNAVEQSMKDFLGETKPDGVGEIILAQLSQGVSRALISGVGTIMNQANAFTMIALQDTPAFLSAVMKEIPWAKGKVLDNTETFLTDALLAQRGKHLAFDPETNQVTGNATIVPDKPVSQLLLSETRNPPATGPGIMRRRWSNRGTLDKGQRWLPANLMEGVYRTGSLGVHLAQGYIDRVMWRTMYEGQRKLGLSVDEASKATDLRFRSVYARTPGIRPEIYSKAGLRPFTMLTGEPWAQMKVTLRELGRNFFTGTDDRANFASFFDPSIKGTKLNPAQRIANLTGFFIAAYAVSEALKRTTGNSSVPFNLIGAWRNMEDDKVYDEGVHSDKELAVGYSKEFLRQSFASILSTVPAVGPLLIQENNPTWKQWFEDTPMAMAGGNGLSDAGGAITNLAGAAMDTGPTGLWQVYADALMAKNNEERDAAYRRGAKVMKSTANVARYIVPLVGQILRNKINTRLYLAGEDMGAPGYPITYGYGNADDEDLTRLEIFGVSSTKQAEKNRAIRRIKRVN